MVKYGLSYELSDKDSILTDCILRKYSDKLRFSDKCSEAIGVLEEENDVSEEITTVCTPGRVSRNCPCGSHSEKELLSISK